MRPDCDYRVRDQPRVGDIEKVCLRSFFEGFTKNILVGAPVFDDCRSVHRSQASELRITEENFM